MIITEFDVRLFPKGKELESAFEVPHENNDSLVMEGCKEERTQQKSNHTNKSVVHDDNSEATGIITVVTRKREHAQISLVKAYFNGKEASIMVDTGSIVSTIHHDDPTQDRIFKILKKRTCS